MKIIVDTNIVFSALVNTQSRIADLLLNSHESFEYYSCYLLVEELQRHRKKLLDLSGLTETQLEVAQIQIFDSINSFQKNNSHFLSGRKRFPL